VEKNMMSKFTADVIARRLPSGKPFINAAGIPPTFFTQFMATNQANLQGVATVPGAQNVLVPKDRIMHTLGSKTYKVNFMLLQANLNNMKEGVSPPATVHPLIVGIDPDDPPPDPERR
jgi:hypothetical protein